MTVKSIHRGDTDAFEVMMPNLGTAQATELSPSLIPSTDSIPSTQVQRHSSLIVS